MKNSHKFLVFLGAAAAGYVAGLLMAPRKGEETRENIRDFIRSHYPGIRERRLEELADQIAREVKEAE